MKYTMRNQLKQKKAIPLIAKKSVILVKCFGSMRVDDNPKNAPIIYMIAGIIRGKAFRLFTFLLNIMVLKIKKAIAKHIKKERALNSYSALALNENKIYHIIMQSIE